MEILMFIFANIVVLLTAVKISSRLKIEMLSDKVLAVIVISISQIIITELFLGMALKCLYSDVLLALDLLIYAIVCIIFRGNSFNKGDVISKLKGIKEQVIHTLKSPIVLMLAGFDVIIIVCLLYSIYNSPPYAYDGLTYHLTSVAFWFQSGAIATLPIRSAILDPWFWCNVYPINGELFMLWFVIFLENDVLVELSQLVFAVIGIAAIYPLCRKLSFSVKNSAIASMLFLLAPIVLLQACVTYVDLIFGVLTIIAINFVFGYYFTKNNHYTYLSAITFGLLIGVKSSGIAYVGILGIALFIFEVINYKKEYSVKQFAKFVSVMALAIILLGGFSYIRNIVNYNNPIYPFELKVAGHEIFKGIGSYKDMIMISNTPKEYLGQPNYLNVMRTWFEGGSKYIYDSAVSGFGPLWIILGVPCIVFTTAIGIYRKNKPYLIMSLIFIIIFLIQPSNWWTRYTIFILAFGSVAIAYMLDYFDTFTKDIIRVVSFVIIVIIFVFATRIVHDIMASNNSQKFNNVPVEKRTVGLYYGGDYAWSDNLPVGSKIGVISDLFIYSLFTPTFDNKVYIVKGQTKEEMFSDINSSKYDYIVMLKNNPEYQEYFSKYGDKLGLYFNGDSLIAYKCLGGKKDEKENE